jgi:MFS family permease
VSRPLARVFAYWRTGLSGPVIVLQAGTAVNYFGTGLILPFEIIYLHELRGFPTATAGLVLAAVMGTAAVVTLPAGALLDRFRARQILIAGNLVSALATEVSRSSTVPGKASSARPSAAPVSQSREPRIKF